MAQSKISGAKTRIDRHGRVVIPAAIRHELGMEPGAVITMTLEDGSLRLITLRQAVKHIQETVKSRTKGRSLVDELIAERRAEAARE